MGQVPYRARWTTNPASAVSESSRRGWVADCEDRFHEPSRLQSSPLLSPKGDTAECEKETPLSRKVREGEGENGRSGERAAGRKRKGPSAERKASPAKGLGAIRHALGASGHWATGGFVEKSNRQAVYLTLTPIDYARGGDR